MTPSHEYANRSDYQFGNVDGNVNIIQGRMTAGGDIIAGNKTVIQNIIQQAAKQIVTAPYKFLASYDISDRDIFFGRNEVIEELVGEIPRHKSLLINGRSGSGKTSLINAGLIPRLAENGYVYVSFRDYRDPLRQLREHLRQHDTFKLDHTESLPLLGILQALSQQQDSRVLVVFDQFERFFVGVSADLRTQFIQEFKVCLESGLSAEEMNVVFSIRQDFFGRLVDEFDSAIPTFFAESARYTLRPLSLAEAREAIVKPLKFVPNLFYNEGFMDDVLLPSLMGQTPDGQQIEPPHLQIVCNQLYEEVRKRHAVDLESGEKPIFIGYDLYHELGETQGILHNYLDDVVVRMTGNNLDRMAIVRSILKLMIETVGTRKFVSLSDLAAGLPDVPQTELNAITGQLQNGRVVEVRGQGQQASYSLSHEFMVEKVQSWYDERELQRKKAQETLERGLAEWRSSQSLLNEKQVAHIRTWLGQEMLDENAETLLTTSQQTYEERKRKEAEQERRSKRLRRIIRVGAALFVLVAGILTFWALWNAEEARTQERLAKDNEQRAVQLADEAKRQEQIAKENEEKAIRERDLARSRQLAMQANTLGDSRTDLSLLLNVEAFNISNNIETQNALLDTLLKNAYLRTFLYGLTDEVKSAALSPDGKMVASGSWGEIVVWDVETGQSIKHLSPVHIALLGHGDLVSTVAFSPDGKWLASGGGAYNQTVELRDIETGKLRGKPLAGHQGGVGSIAFSPDGTLLASGGWNNTIWLWDLETSQPMGLPLTGSKTPVSCIVFSPNGTLLASDSDDTIIKLWDVKTGQPVGQPFSGHSEKVQSLAFSPDGTKLASSANDGTIRLWNIEVGQLIGQPLTGHKGAVSSVAFSPDGTKVISGGEDKTVRLWDVETGRQISQLLTSFKGSVSSVIFSQDTRWLALGSWNKALILWDANRAQPIGRTLADSVGTIQSMAFSPDGKRLALGCQDGSIIRWDVQTNQPVDQPLIGHVSTEIFGNSFVWSVAFSPDGTRLASGGGDGTIKIWDMETGQALREISYGHTPEILTFSPDGTRLSSGANDGIIRLWDVETGQQIGQPLTGHEGAVSSVAFSPDGAKLVSGGWDKTVRLWNVETGQPIGQPFTDLFNMVYSVAFSPDGERVASGTGIEPRTGTMRDGAITLWDVKTGEQIGQPITGHKGAVLSVTFSPDGVRLVSGGEDETIRLWNLETRQLIGQPLTGHNSDIYHVAFNSDGTMLVSSSKEGIILWNIAPESWQKKACQIANRNLTYAEWQSLFKGEPYRKICPDLPVHDSVITKARDLAKTGDINGATAIFQQVAGLDVTLNFEPTTEATRWAVEGFIERGTTLAQKGNIDEATALFQKALDLNPDLELEPQTEAGRSAAQPLLKDAENLVKKGDIKGAVEILRKALEFDPGLVLDPEVEANKLDCIERGRKIAQEGDVDGAMALFEKALKLDPDLDLEPGAELRRLAVPALVRNGKELAKKGDLEAAMAVFQKALDLDPDLGIEPEVDARKFDLIGRGERLAEEGDVDGATIFFQQALDLDPDLSIDPKTEAKRLAVPTLVKRGKELAKDGDWDGARVLFEKALKLDPALDLDPKAEIRRAATNLMWKGNDLVKHGEIKEALSTYKKVQMFVPPLEIPVEHWDFLCWRGSLLGYAANVMEACEQAVALDPETGLYPHRGILAREARGIARALTGDIEGAIEDFEAYIAWSKSNETRKLRYQNWIDALQKDENPFTEEVFEKLRKE